MREKNKKNIKKENLNKKSIQLNDEEIQSAEVKPKASAETKSKTSAKTGTKASVNLIVRLALIVVVIMVIAGSALTTSAIFTSKTEESALTSFSSLDLNAFVTATDVTRSKSQNVKYVSNYFNDSPADLINNATVTTSSGQLNSFVRAQAQYTFLNAEDSSLNANLKAVLTQLNTNAVQTFTDGAYKWYLHSDGYYYLVGADNNVPYRAEDGAQYKLIAQNAPVRYNGISQLNFNFSVAEQEIMSSLAFALNFECVQYVEGVTTIGDLVENIPEFNTGNLKQKTYGKVISFDSNGGEPLPAVLTEQDIFSLASYVPTREGYDFVSWQQSETDISQIAFVAGTDPLQTVVAKWAPRAYNITYRDANDLPYSGSAISTETDGSYIHGTEKVLPIVTKNGYTFAGWFADSYCTRAFSRVPATQIGDVTVYAKWNPNSLLISYAGMEGAVFTSSSTQNSFYFGSNDVIILPQAFKFGFTFEGWFTEPNGAGERVSNIFCSQEIDNVTVYAYFRAIEYRIQFDAGEGTAVIENGVPLLQSITYYSNTSFNLPSSNVITRDGYEFLGWKVTQSSGSNWETDTIYLPGSFYAQTPLNYRYGNVILTSAWKYQVVEADLELYASQETSSLQSSYRVSLGEMIVLSENLNNPKTTNTLSQIVATRKGYIFVGWNTQPNSLVPTIQNAYKVNASDIQGDKIKLYAVWLPISYFAVTNASNSAGNYSTYAIAETGESAYLYTTSNPSIAFLGATAYCVTSNINYHIGDTISQNAVSGALNLTSKNVNLSATNNISNFNIIKGEIVSTNLSNLTSLASTNATIYIPSNATLSLGTENDCVTIRTKSHLFFVDGNLIVNNSHMEMGTILSPITQGFSPLITINNSGLSTIRENTTITFHANHTASGKSNYSPIRLQGTAPHLTIEGGNFVSSKVGSIIYQDAGQTTIQNGVFIVNSSKTNPATNFGFAIKQISGLVQIDNGKFVSYDQNTLLTCNGGNLTINNGTFESESSVLILEPLSSAVTINDGKFIETNRFGGSTIKVNGGNLNINGGEITNQVGSSNNNSVISCENKTSTINIFNARIINHNQNSALVIGNGVTCVIGGNSIISSRTNSAVSINAHTSSENNPVVPQQVTIRDNAQIISNSEGQTIFVKQGVLTLEGSCQIINTNIGVAIRIHGDGSNAGTGRVVIKSNATANMLIKSEGTAIYLKAIQGETYQLDIEQNAGVKIQGGKDYGIQFESGTYARINGGTIISLSNYAVYSSNAANILIGGNAIISKHPDQSPLAGQNQLASQPDKHALFIAGTTNITITGNAKILAYESCAIYISSGDNAATRNTVLELLDNVQIFSEANHAIYLGQNGPNAMLYLGSNSLLINATSQTNKLMNLKSDIAFVGVGTIRATQKTMTTNLTTSIVPLIVEYVGTGTLNPGNIIVQYVASEIKNNFTLKHDVYNLVYDSSNLIIGTDSRVVYDGNGGTLTGMNDVNSYLNGATVNVKFPTMDGLQRAERTGYAFLGWSRDKFTSQPEYTQNGVTSFIIQEYNVILYAVWKIRYVEMYYEGNSASNTVGRSLSTFYSSIDQAFEAYNNDTDSSFTILGTSYAINSVTFKLLKTNLSTSRTFVFDDSPTSYLGTKVNHANAKTINIMADITSTEPKFILNVYSPNNAFIICSGYTLNIWNITVDGCRNTEARDGATGRFAQVEGVNATLNIGTPTASAIIQNFSIVKTDNLLSDTPIGGAVSVVDAGTLVVNSNSVIQNCSVEWRPTTTISIDPTLSGERGNFSGSAIWAENPNAITINSNALISNCQTIFEGGFNSNGTNSNLMLGGAISCYLNNNGPLTMNGIITDCSVTVKNTHVYIGGVLNADRDTFYIKGVGINVNVNQGATSPNNYLSLENAIIKNCYASIQSHTGYVNGIGIRYAFYGTNANNKANATLEEVRIENCVGTGNEWFRGDVRGGGMFIEGGNSHITLTDCTFQNNDTRNTSSAVYSAGYLNVNGGIYTGSKTVFTLDGPKTGVTYSTQTVSFAGSLEIHATGYDAQGVRTTGNFNGRLIVNATPRESKVSVIKSDFHVGLYLDKGYAEIQKGQIESGSSTGIHIVNATADIQTDGAAVSGTGAGASVNHANSILYVNGGNVITTSGNGIHINEGGKAIVNGGLVNSNSTSYYAIRVQNGFLQVNNGTVQSGAGTAIIVEDNGVAHIGGGKVQTESTGNYNAIKSSAYKTFTYNSVNYKALTITGGEITSPTTGATIYVQGSASNSKTAVRFQMSGGTIKNDRETTVTTNNSNANAFATKSDVYGVFNMTGGLIQSQSKYPTMKLDGVESTGMDHTKRKAFTGVNSVFNMSGGTIENLNNKGDNNGGETIDITRIPLNMTGGTIRSAREDAISLSANNAWAVISGTALVEGYYCVQAYTANVYLYILGGTFAAKQYNIYRNGSNSGQYNIEITGGTFCQLGSDYVSYNTNQGPNKTICLSSGTAIINISGGTLIAQSQIIYASATVTNMNVTISGGNLRAINSTAILFDIENGESEIIIQNNPTIYAYGCLIKTSGTDSIIEISGGTFTGGAELTAHSNSGFISPHTTTSSITISGGVFGASGSANAIQANAIIKANSSTSTIIDITGGTFFCKNVFFFSTKGRTELNIKDSSAVAITAYGVSGTLINGKYEYSTGDMANFNAVFMLGTTNANSFVSISGANKYIEGENLSIFASLDSDWIVKLADNPTLKISGSSSSSFNMFYQADSTAGKIYLGGNPSFQSQTSAFNGTILSIASQNSVYATADGTASGTPLANRTSNAQGNLTNGITIDYRPADKENKIAVLQTGTNSTTNHLRFDLVNPNYYLDYDAGNTRLIIKKSAFNVIYNRNFMMNTGSNNAGDFGRMGTAYTALYSTNSSTFIEGKSEYNGTLLPLGYARTGYRFTGWSTNQNGGASNNTRFTTPANELDNIIAGTYQLNIEVGSVDGKTITAESTTYAANGIDVQNQTFRLYAQWEQETYSVTLDISGSSGAKFAEPNISSTTQQIISGKKYYDDPSTGTTENGISLEQYTPYRDGYSFQGWVETRVVNGQTYVRVFYHDPYKVSTSTYDSSNHNMFANNSEAEYVNSSYGKYSNLINMVNIKGGDSAYTYLMELSNVYDNSGNLTYMNWTQTVNPLTQGSQTSVGTYTRIGDNAKDKNEFNGLGLSTSTNETYLDGNVNHGHWFHAMGAKVYYNSGIPSMDGHHYALPNATHPDTGATCFPLSLWQKIGSGDNLLVDNGKPLGVKDYYYVKGNVTLKPIWKAVNYEVYFNTNDTDVYNSKYHPVLTTSNFADVISLVHAPNELSGGQPVYVAKSKTSGIADLPGTSSQAIRVDIKVNGSATIENLPQMNFGNSNSNAYLRTMNIFANSNAIVWTVEKEGNFIVIASQGGQHKLNVKNITIQQNRASAKAGRFAHNESGELNIQSGAKFQNYKSTDSGAVIWQNTGKTTIVSGALFQNNLTTAGGGVIYNDGGTITMSGGEFKGNVANGNGGAIYHNGGTFTMSGGTIGESSGATATSSSRSNQAVNGGGVFVNGGNFNLSGGTIGRNYATTSGGGVYKQGSGIFSMSGGNICLNAADSVGGVRVQAGTFEMINANAKIYSNSANTNAGGVGVLAGAFNMTNGQIYGNRANGADTQGNGGGVFVGGSGTFTFSGGTIGKTGTPNIANRRGGGVFVESGTFEMKNANAIVGENTNTAATTTSYSNTAQYGGGVFVDGSGTFNFSAGVIAKNYASEEGGGGVSFRGETGNWSGTATIKSNYAAWACTEFEHRSGTLTISGGTYTSNTAEKGVAECPAGTLTISGGTFTANAHNTYGTIYSRGSHILNMTGGEIRETGGNSSGICGRHSTNGKVSITGGTINVQNTSNANTTSYPIKGIVSSDNTEWGKFYFGGSTLQLKGNSDGYHVLTPMTSSIFGKVGSNNFSKNAGNTAANGFRLMINYSKAAPAHGEIVVSTVDSTALSMAYGVVVTGTNGVTFSAAYESSSKTIKIFNNSLTTSGGDSNNDSNTAWYFLGYLPTNATYDGSVTRYNASIANRSFVYQLATNDWVYLWNQYNGNSGGTSVTTAYIGIAKTTTTVSATITPSGVAKTLYIIDMNRDGMKTLTATNTLSGSMFNFSSGYGVTIDGLHLTRASGGSASLTGITVNANASLTFVRNNKISAFNNSGLITGGTTTITGAGSIESCTATNGGGVRVTGGTFTLNGAVFEIKNNTATNGGGIYHNAGTSELRAGNIRSNAATNGGGIYANATLTFPLESTITVNKNIASASGGGVYVASGKTFNFNDGFIGGNKAATSGGGIYSAGTTNFGNAGNGTSNVYNSYPWSLPSGWTASMSALSMANQIITCVSVGGCEYYQFPVNLTANTKYVFTLDIESINTAGSNPMSFGLADSQLSGTGNPDNNDLVSTNKMIKGANIFQRLQFVYTPTTTKAHYVYLNFGYLSDGQTHQIKVDRIIIHAGNVSAPTIARNTTTAEESSGGAIYQNGGDFTMAGLSGIVRGSVPNGKGGAIYFKDCTDAKMNDGLIHSTGAGTTSGKGGGVYVEDSTVTFKNWSFNSCSAQDGGAFYVESGTLNIQGGAINGNKASRNGGAIFSSGNLNISGGNIYSNTATSNGGGVYQNAGNFTQSGGNIRNNTATANGGGVYKDGTGEFKFTGGVIKANLANSGGGVFFNGGTFTMNNANAIIGDLTAPNISNLNGGGVYQNGGTFNFSAGVIGNSGGATETNGTAINSNDGSFANKAGGSGNYHGGGIYHYGGTLNLSGTAIIARNYTPYRAGGIYSRSTFSIDGTGVHISYNLANFGGGIWLNNAGASFTFTAGNIHNNKASNGGGIVVGWDCTTADKKVIDGADAKIYNNDATNGNGGGIYLEAWTGGTSATATAGAAILKMTAGQIYSNTATSNGGGIFMTSSSNTTATTHSHKISIFTMSSGNIHDNTAKYGGGIYGNGSNISLSGSAIVESNDATGATDSRGGGIFIKNNGDNLLSTLTLNGANVFVRGNTATQSGGGIYHTSGTFKLTNGTISGNVANGSNAVGVGGGIFMEAGTFTMSGGNINSNTASVHGGGVYFRAGTFNLSGGNIYSNTATSNGGGVYQNAGNFTQSGGNIRNNTATANGGGVYKNAGTFTMNNSNAKIYSNTASSGGGVYNHDETFTMSNGQIYSNTATANGGGVFVAGGTFIMTGGTVGSDSAPNKAPNGGGGGICVAGSATANISGGTIGSTTQTLATGTTACANYAKYGGGIDVAGDGGKLTLSGSAIVGRNWSSGDSGGVRSRGTTTNFNGGQIRYNASAGDGGGVTMHVNGHGYFVSTEVHHNKSNTNGGGIKLWHYNSTQKSKATISASSIHDNQATNGAGVYLNGELTMNSTNANVHSNSASTNGGGVYLNTGTFTFTGGNIRNNTATSHGGGVFLNGGEFTMNHAHDKIYSNTATSNGGGVYLNGGTFNMSGGVIGDSSKTSVATTSSRSNTAKWGGGVFQNGGTFNLSGGYISYNYASSFTNTPEGKYMGGGGGIFSRGGFTFTGGNVQYNLGAGGGGGIFLAMKSDNTAATSTMSGGEVDGNSSTTDGGGIYVGALHTLTFSGGCIGKRGASATATTSNYSNFAQYGGGLYVRGSVTMSGNAKVVYNYATKRGGGVQVQNNAITGLTLPNSAFIMDGNANTKVNYNLCQGDGADYGGGIGCNTANTVIEIKGGEVAYNTIRRVVTNNTATANFNSPAHGGGIGTGAAVALTLQGTASKPVSIRNNTVESTLTANFPYQAAARVWGGGIMLNNGSATMSISGTVTITENTLIATSTNSNASGTTLVERVGGGIVQYNGSTTMSGGTVSNHTTATHGGGVYVYNGTFTMSGGNIYSNTATSNGGGVYFRAGTFNLSGGNIYSNTATNNNGGGVFVAGGTFIMTGGTVGSDSAPNKAPNGGGGGICVAGSATADISGGTIGSTTNSLATGTTVCANYAKWGGGIDVAGDGGKLTLSGRAIVGRNWSSGDSGGVRSRGTTTNFNGGQIRYNASAGDGGGVTMHVNGHGYFAGTEVHHNKSNTNGGGIKLWQYNSTQKSKATISASSIHDNQATNGAGVYLNGELTMNSTNANVHSNSASTNGGGVYLNTGTFTFTGGNIRNNTATSHGGGVFLNGGEFTMNHAHDKIYSNTATLNGGGVFVAGGTFGMSNGLIYSNTAKNGGGVYLNAGTFNFSGGTIGDQTKATEISGSYATSSACSNKATDGDSSSGGGGIYQADGSLIITGSAKIAYNYSAARGGAIRVNNGTKTTINSTSIYMSWNTAGWGGGLFVQNSTNFTFTAGNIQYNDATSVGGGIAFGWATTTAKAKINGANAKIKNNRAQNGGGIYIEAWNGGSSSHATAGGLTLSAGEISNNNAGTDGGGIWIGKSGVSQTYGDVSLAVLTMTGGSIAGNTASRNGGGVFTGGVFTMTGGIIGDSTDSTATVEHCSNKATDGGGIYLNSGTFEINTNISICRNYATSEGGAIYNGSTGVLMISNGTIRYNGAVAGGAICQVQSSNNDMVISGGTFLNNGGSANTWYWQSGQRITNVYITICNLTLVSYTFNYTDNCSTGSDGDLSNFSAYNSSWPWRKWTYTISFSGERNCVATIKYMLYRYPWIDANVGKIGIAWGDYARAKLLCSYSGGESDKQAMYDCGLMVHHYLTRGDSRISYDYNENLIEAIVTPSSLSYIFRSSGYRLSAIRNTKRGDNERDSHFDFCVKYEIGYGGNYILYEPQSYWQYYLDFWSGGY